MAADLRKRLILASGLMLGLGLLCNGLAVILGYGRPFEASGGSLDSHALNQIALFSVLNALGGFCVAVAVACAAGVVALWIIDDRFGGLTRPEAASSEPSDDDDED